MKKILLIAPEFFGYHKLIQSELEKQGWNVTYMSDRPSQNAIIKILIRKMRCLLNFYLTSFFTKKLAEICGSTQFDQIVVIKGEGLTTSVFKQLRQYTRGPISLYFWDALSNVQGGLQNCRLADRVYTFDPVDAKNYGLKLLPLFYVESNTPKLPQKWDLSFVGSVHGDRLKVTAKIKESLKSQRLFVFIYFPSILLYRFRSFFDRSFAHFQSEELSLVSIPKARTEEIFAESRAVLDIHHAKQVGLTMRTLEALALGKKLVTTNQSVQTYPFFHPSQILIIDRNEPVIPFSFFESDVTSHVKDHIKAYEIGEWVKTLTSLT